VLKQLGYEGTCHYFSMLMENPPDSEMWVEAFEAKFEGKGTFGRGRLGPATRTLSGTIQNPIKRPQRLLSESAQAVTDTSCNVFSEELMATYPDAKIILSVRDSADQWYITGSMQLFIHRLYQEPGFMGWLNSHLADRPKEDAMVWKMLQHTY